MRGFAGSLSASDRRHEFGAHLERLRSDLVTSASTAADGRPNLQRAVYRIAIPSSPGGQPYSRSGMCAGGLVVSQSRWGIRLRMCRGWQLWS
jgi:hypothetical protein